MRRVLRFLGVRRSTGALLTMVVLVGAGENMAERFLPIYLIALGGGALTIGLLNGLDNLLSALYSFPGGYLSDRLGYKAALVVFNLVAMAGYLLVIIWPVWQAVIAGAVLFLSWSALSLPASMSLVNRVLPPSKQVMGVSMHSLVRRFPMAIGPLIGGALIVHYGEVAGVRLAFVVALVLGLLSLIVQQLLIEAPDRASRPAETNPVRLWRFMTPDLRHLLVSDILVRFCEQIPYAFVVVWAMKNVGVTALQFGVLTTVEMVVAVLCYVPVAYLADRGTKKPFVLITFVSFMLFPIVLLFARSFAGLVLAFVVRGFKEFGEPTRKSLILDLAPADRKAGMFGLYYLVRDVIVSAAAFGGAFLWQASPNANLLAAAFFGLLGVVYFAIYGRDPAPGPETAPAG